MKKFHMAYCLIPVAVAAVLVIGFEAKLPALGLLLLCPLMMIVMMRMMMGGGGHGEGGTEQGDVSSPRTKPPSSVET